MKEVIVIGAGLAGCECALQLASHGVKVLLYEQKPKKFSPAHTNKNFCELVCSNTLKSNSLDYATGLLKAELKELNSPVLECAYKCRVPAGDALAVDRNQFAEMVTNLIRTNENITVIEEEVKTIPLDKPVVVASGPLTSDELAEDIKKLTGDGFYFYDALAPIVELDSIDLSKTFTADRWNDEDGSHINCVMNKEEYTTFWQALTTAERVPLKNFETEKVFEGCLPVEVMAKRDFDALRFGPMKGKGFKLNDGTTPYAVLQLRQESVNGNLYNLVGCQTNLTYPEQRRVFSLIPALKNVQFARYGAMHRNSYINAPKTLTSRFCLKNYKNVFFAGQISGVEGYLESIASGSLCAIYMWQYLNSGAEFALPATTALGALGNYLVCASEINFQPMHITWGILSPINASKDEKKKALVERALSDIKKIKEQIWK
ncbi:MAG: methylenetetrahydrofolate--tRNA-(uracil(54)-C(5))-methyltransferase (FADH(2)-oxidizing) TrmFO [Clostridia bacterium]|nr:methylenetetrahydrofolate--tRNA-(uracil(54)-C(5))-methyltransferase (FADH(2)-oxidizing) TrmFO [Clostridia bacterium]